MLYNYLKARKYYMWEYRRIVCAHGLWLILRNGPLSQDFEWEEPGIILMLLNWGRFMDAKQMKEVKDVVVKATLIPDGKCVACHYSEMIHEGIISHISPFPAHTCKQAPHESEDKYEQEARRIAKILAMDQLFGSDLVWDEMEELHRQLYISSKLPAARAMVAEMSAQFDQGYKQALEDSGTMHPAYSVSCNKAKRLLGLIPSPNKPGE